MKGRGKQAIVKLCWKGIASCLRTHMQKERERIAGCSGIRRIPSGRIWHRKDVRSVVLAKSPGCWDGTSCLESHCIFFWRSCENCSRHLFAQEIISWQWYRSHSGDHKTSSSVMMIFHANKWEAESPPHPGTQSSTQLQNQIIYSELEYHPLEIRTTLQIKAGNLDAANFNVSHRPTGLKLRTLTLGPTKCPLETQERRSTKETSEWSMCRGISSLVILEEKQL